MDENTVLCYPCKEAWEVRTHLRVSGKKLKKGTLLESLLVCYLCINESTRHLFPFEIPLISVGDVSFII